MNKKTMVLIQNVLLSQGIKPSKETMKKAKKIQKKWWNNLSIKEKTKQRKKLKNALNKKEEKYVE